MSFSDASQGRRPDTVSVTNIYSSDFAPPTVSQQASVSSFFSSPSRKAAEAPARHSSPPPPAPAFTESEVAALDASAAANCAEAEAALHRTTATAHSALQTAQHITTQLSMQGESVTAVEEALQVNQDEWHKGRKEMRRTRHWYVALGHWLRCGGAASIGNVAANKTGKNEEQERRKEKGSRLLRAAPMAEPTLSSQKGTQNVCDGEPLQGERVTVSAPSAAYDEKGVSAAAFSSGHLAAHHTVKADSQAERRRGVVGDGSRLHRSRANRRADLELCERLEPGVAEVHQLVREMHAQALLHAEMLDQHNSRLDSACEQAAKTANKNVKAVKRQ